VPVLLAKKGMSLAILSLVWGAALPQDSPPTAQQPTFRSQSNVVLVPALVKDKNGSIVYGLGAGDFLIEDDGAEQPVRLDDSPESTPVSLVIAVQLGRTAAAELPRIRSLGKMLDPLLSQGRNRAAIVTFDSDVELVRNFTTNGALIAADLGGLRPGDHNAAILDAVGLAVALLKREPEERQRVLLLVSETRDHGSRLHSIQDTVRAIADSNVVVYTLAFSPTVSSVLDNLRGKPPGDLPPGPPDQIPDAATGPGGVPRGGINFWPLLVAAVQAMRANTPKTLAGMTGGEYELFKSSKSFEFGMTDFANHLHNRYLLSFEPKDPHDGLHKVRVRLRKPEGRNYTVVARDRYWADTLGEVR
jgi:VWFA-related protein